MSSEEPHTGHARARRVRALLDMGRVDRAMAEARGLLAHEPHDPDALELVALCHIRLGEHARAREVLREAMAEAPDRAHLHYLAGHAASRERDHRAAEAGFREALRLDPEEPVYLRAGAEFLAGQQRHDEALALAQRAVAAGADRASNHRTLGFVASSAGQLDLAWRSYTKAIELDPEDGDAWNNLGCVAFARGERLLAREHFREALRLDPHGERTRQNLALVTPVQRPLAIYKDVEAFLGEVLRDLADAGKLGGPLRAMALAQAFGQAAVARALTTRVEQRGALGRLGVVGGSALLRTALRRLAPSSVRGWAVAGAAAGVGWLATVPRVTPQRRRYVEQILAARKAWEDGRKDWLDGRTSRSAREAAVVRLLERLAMMLSQQDGGDPEREVDAPASESGPERPGGTDGDG